MVEKDTLGAIDLILYQIRQQGTHFLLISMERTYEFETESEEECARWVFSIQKQIKSVRKELMRKSTGGAQRLALAPAHVPFRPSCLGLMLRGIDSRLIACVQLDRRAKTWLCSTTS